MRKILNEQLDITDAHPLKARFYDYKNFTYPWHFHSEFEVIYIEKGYGLGMAGDGMTDFSDQQLFLLGSNLPHYLENAPEYNLKEELRVNGVIIQFEKDFIAICFLALQPVSRYQPPAGRCTKGAAVFIIQLHG